MAGAQFEPPLILRATSRPRWARLCDCVLTLVLWGGWLYLLVACIGTLWVPPFVQFMLPVDPPDRPWDVLVPAALSVVLAITIAVVLYVRAQADRRRFGGQDRRRGFPATDELAIAKDFGVALDELRCWRMAALMTVHHDRGGRIIGVEVAHPDNRRHSAEEEGPTGPGPPMAGALRQHGFAEPVIASLDIDVSGVSTHETNR